MKLLLLIFVFACPVLAQQADTNGKAIVYVYSYATTTTIGQIRKPVFLDGKEIADIRPERYFIAVIGPGKHIFHLKNKKLGGIEKDFVAGITYYIRIDWRNNGMMIVPAGCRLNHRARRHKNVEIDLQICRSVTAAAFDF